MMPSLFIAHGSPMIAIETSPYVEFLQNFASTLPQPRAVIVFSAHWESPMQMVSAVFKHQPMYDFGGFPDALYQVRYCPPGDPDLARSIVETLQAEGIMAAVDERRALDHGVWTVLSRLWPDAEIPVVAMSVNPQLGFDASYRIGARLEFLRDENVLIVGSGVTVHNFQLLAHRADPHMTARVLEFETWLETQLLGWNLEALAHYETEAPHARLAVPAGANEHLVPLFYAMGAADQARHTKMCYRDLQWNVMTNSVYRFG
jgi:4,5-DOPA dioxygenase extradiol